MLAAIRLAITDLRIRAIAIALVLLGFTYASTFPYQSLIGTQQLGMSERQFGLLIFAIGFAGMGAFYGIGGALVLGAAIVLTGCLALAFLDARRGGVG